MRVFTITSLLIFSFYIVLLSVIYFNQRSLLYHPHKEEHPLSYYHIDNAEEITLTTEDNIKLEAWYRPADKNHDMIIFLHGNAGNLNNRAEHLKILAQMGYGFIIPAWRGFGKSKGTPTMDGLFLDAKAAIKFVQEKGYDLKHTIIIGESLGTGIATQMALEYKFKGLFLITPYTSIADRASEIYPFMFAQVLTKDNFKVLDNIKSINQPLLIIHGTEDKVVPYQHSEKIYAAALEPKKLIIYPDKNHVDYDKKQIFLEMNNYFSAIEQ